MYRFIYLFVCLLLWLSSVAGQDKYKKIEDDLNQLASKDIPALNEKVTLSVTNVSIQEFVRGVANSSGLNINVDPALNVSVINNFTNVRVADIILFLCKQYDLSLTIIGSIINLTKEAKSTVVEKKKLVTYEQESQLVSIDCDNQDLLNLTREFAQQTSINIVPAQGLERFKVTGYVQKLSVETALDKFAYANGLVVKKDNEVWLVEKKEAPQQAEKSGSRRDNASKSDVSADATMKINPIIADTISIIAKDANIIDIIKKAADILKINYYFLSEIKGTATITIAKISFPDLLRLLFAGSNNNFQQIYNVYVIGDSKTRELKDFKLIRLQNRTVDKLKDIVPADFLKELEVKEFPDLNGMLASGTPEAVKSLEAFIQSIDKTVPVIMIEVLIIDNKSTYKIQTGMNAGLGEKPAVTSGTIFPAVDMTLSSTSINNLLNSFDGFGSVKIGKVTPNFFITLKALENDGIINIRSTPKLATLNGHEATLSIGRTEYYLEEQSNVYGSLSSSITKTQIYKDVEAKLSIKIKPFVSSDDQITLEIEVEQSDFTERISNTAPPGKVSRNFKSMIRVRDQEMVLLGGLEEKRTSDSGSGVPFLSRIPIIKWLFSSKTNEKSKTKLNIFIKPSIVS